MFVSFLTPFEITSPILTIIFGIRSRALNVRVLRFNAVILPAELLLYCFPLRKVFSIKYTYRVLYVRCVCSSIIALSSHTYLRRLVPFLNPFVFHSFLLVYVHIISTRRLIISHNLLPSII